MRNQLFLTAAFYLVLYDDDFQFNLSTSFFAIFLDDPIDFD